MSKVTEHFDSILDTVKIDTTCMALNGRVLSGVTFNGEAQVGTLRAVSAQGVKDCVADMLRDFCAVGSVLETAKERV